MRLVRSVKLGTYRWGYHIYSKAHAIDPRQGKTRHDNKTASKGADSLSTKVLYYSR